MKISGIGCCLIDYVYTDCSYEHPLFNKLKSKIPGDGGLIPGGLVFSEDLEAFAGMPFQDMLAELVGESSPSVTSLGGPAAAALVHVSQLLAPFGVECSFHAAVGADKKGKEIAAFLSRTPLHAHLKVIPAQVSPSTIVLTDPSQHAGKGERTFINTLGTAALYSREMLPDEVFKSDILLFGGTALVPHIHDDLTCLLKRAKHEGTITVVGTVYDFRNEKRYPGSLWPLGSRDSYAYIDLLVTDAEEAYKLTGKGDLHSAAEQFIKWGVGSLMITHGGKDMLIWSGGSIWSPLDLTPMPVCRYVDDLLESQPERRGDTTGCGDNFIGGVVASLAIQKLAGTKTPDILEACAWGAASGGFACMYRGGTYYEKAPGEKLAQVDHIVDEYRKQAGLSNSIEIKA